MSRRMIIAAVAGCLGMALCALASADISAFWVPVASGDGSVGSTYPPAAIKGQGGDPLLLGMQTWDLKVTADGNWTLGRLRATLPDGEFYNHPLGGSTRPCDSFNQIFPALQFDTYVTSPSDRGCGGIAAPSILGGFPETEPLSMSGNVISVFWGDLVFDPPGTFQIARLTFPLGVIPDILTMDQNPNFSRASQTTPDSSAAIPEIPEPAMLHLISMAGLLGLRRQSRCSPRNA